MMNRRRLLGQNIPLDSGLVMYLSLEGHYNDKVGGNNGFNANSVTYDYDATLNRLVYNGQTAASGVNFYIPAAIIGTDVTVSIWMYSNTNNFNWDMVINGGTTSNNGVNGCRQIVWARNSNATAADKGFWQSYNAGTSIWTRPRFNYQVPIGSWYNVIFTYQKSNGEGRVYLNNVEQTPYNNNRTFRTDLFMSRAIISGLNNDRNSHLRFYNRVLTASERSELYNNKW